MEPTANVLAVDSQGRIDADLPCVGCGYNLRGLLPDGTCPECALAVRRSTQSNLLRFSNPDWLEQLAGGIGVILASIAATALVFGYWGTSGSSALLRYSLAGGLAHILVRVTLMVGCWKVTTPEPAVREKRFQFTARRIFRWAALACGVLSLLRQTPQVDLFIHDSVVETFGWLCLPVMFYGAMIYGSRIALRIPDVKLSRRTRIALGGMAVCLLIVFGVDAVLPDGLSFIPTPGTETVKQPTSTVPPTIAGIVTGVACIAIVACPIIGVWLLSVLVEYWLAFRKAARDARATWAQPPRQAEPGIVQDRAPNRSI